jgi:hypothetical protein
MEDEAAVAARRSTRLRFFAGGRYASRHERGVHDFHRLLAQAPV